MQEDEEEEEKEEEMKENEVWDKRKMKEGVETLVFETNYTDFNEEKFEKGYRKVLEQILKSFIYRNVHIRSYNHFPHYYILQMLNDQQLEEIQTLELSATDLFFHKCEWPPAKFEHFATLRPFLDKMPNL